MIVFLMYYHLFYSGSHTLSGKSTLIMAKILCVSSVVEKMMHYKFTMRVLCMEKGEGQRIIGKGKWAKMGRGGV